VTVRGRVAFVTGAGSGIGEGIALALAEAGAAVAVVDLDGAGAERVAADAAARGVEASWHVADVSDQVSVEAVVDAVVAHHGRLDIAVNNAGIYRDAVAIDATPPDQWDLILDVNIRSQFLVARSVVPHMKRNAHGRIVNLASRRWLGGPGLAAYSASKGAVISLTRSLALELGAFGITANAVSPSMVVTPLFLAMPEHERAEVLARVSTQAVPRPGTPADIANAVLFFAADESGYVTGQNLYVAGGQELGSSGVT
jgi:NAD(P)-dependent dehydrogenase (short-subunit alcohol dehydrogenase family)